MWSPHKTERAEDCLGPRNAVLGHLQPRYPEEVFDPVAQPRGGGLGDGFNGTVVHPVHSLRLNRRQVEHETMEVLFIQMEMVLTYVSSIKKTISKTTMSEYIDPIP